MFFFNNVRKWLAKYYLNSNYVPNKRYVASKRYEQFALNGNIGQMGENMVHSS